MKNLFNRSFFGFTFGFICILITSFMFAAIVAHLDEKSSMSATAERGR